MSSREYDQQYFTPKRIAATAFASVAALTSVAAAYDSFFTIAETERGLMYNMGKLAANDVSDLRKPGLNFKLPFVQSVKKMPIGQQQIPLENENIYTKDSQDLNATILLTYNLPEANLINIARRNPDYGRVLVDTVRQALKDSFGRKEATDIPATRNAIMRDATDNARTLVNNQLGINIQNITMPNFDYNNAFKSAIVRATQMKAEAERARQEVEKIKAESDSKRETAHALADVARTTADANLYKAQKEAQGIQAITGAIGEKNLPQYWAMQRWNGQLPTVTGGSVPVVDVSKITGAAAASASKSPAP